jgi:hypothetical protein
MSGDTTEDGVYAPRKTLLRLPRGLHDHLKELAQENAISANTLMVALLAGGTGWNLDIERTRAARTAGSVATTHGAAHEQQRSGA